KNQIGTAVSRALDAAVFISRGFHHVAVGRQERFDAVPRLAVIRNRQDGRGTPEFVFDEGRNAVSIQKRRRQRSWTVAAPGVCALTHRRAPGPFLPSPWSWNRRCGSSTSPGPQTTRSASSSAWPRGWNRRRRREWSRDS